MLEKEKHKNVPREWIQIGLSEIAEILDYARVPINSKEREKRIQGKTDAELFPYYGATGQVGVIDGYLFEGEHVLLGEDGAPFLDSFKEKAYIVNGRFWVNNHAHILRAYFSNKYLCYYLNQISYKPYVTGTTRLKLNQSSMWRIPISFAPFQEQEQIANKIEELFSDLDNAIENLKKAQEQLKVYRQAVLKWAFDGKMTVVNDELLETTLSTEFEIIMGQSPESKHYNQKGEGLPFFQGKKEFTELYAKVEVWSREATKVAEKDDVLLSIRAPIGPVNLAPTKCGIGRGLAAIKPNQKTKSKFILYLLKNIEGELVNRGTGTTFKAITKPRLYSIPIRIPATKEGRDIILQEIESRFSVCDKIEETIKNSLNQSESLRQSILKQAFEGKLTEQWRREHLDLISGENSADALLKKIKAEKGALQVKPKGKKKYD